MKAAAPSKRSRDGQHEPTAPGAEAEAEQCIVACRRGSKLVIANPVPRALRGASLSVPEMPTECESLQEAELCSAQLVSAWALPWLGSSARMSGFAWMAAVAALLQRSYCRH